MDPFLESPVFFGDLHNGLIYNLQAQLQRDLPPAYYASKSDRVWVEVEDQRRMIEPDVSVLRRDRETGGENDVPGTIAGDVAVAEPLVIPVVHDEQRETYVDILTRASQGEVIVATIEILSPTNKHPGSAGRKLYLGKQKEILDEGRIHLVEIDLLRSGEHTAAMPRSAAVRRVRLPYLRSPSRSLA